MNKGPDSTATQPAPEQDDFVARKLIRPTRSDASGAAAAPAPERRERHGTRRPLAPDQTHAENFYFQKQMQSHTPLTLVLRTGETLTGTIEWFDKTCIKLAKPRGGSVLVYKQAIRYLHKSGE